MHHQLHSNSSNKIASITDIPAASREDEARCKAALLEVRARDRMRHRRLPCAGHAAQPEEALLVFAISLS
jgi:hypothetical protein